MNRIIVTFLCIALILTGCSINQTAKKKQHQDTKEALSETEEPEECDNSDYEVKTIEITKRESNSLKAEVLSVANLYRDIYRKAEKGDASNVSLKENIVHQIVDCIGNRGYTVTCSDHDYNMINYRKMDDTLKKARNGETTKTEFFRVNQDGSFIYYQLDFSKKNMIATVATIAFGKDMNPYLTFLEKSHVYQWNYTRKGWFIWQKALSENQEMSMYYVTRVLPLDEKCRAFCEKYIEPISYMGNNLFLTDWDTTCMDNLVFNDVYEFIYSIERNKGKEDSYKFPYKDGVPKEKFESIIELYFPITDKELERVSGYDEKKEIYTWVPMGIGTVIPQFQPIPEVVRYKDNKDGSITIYVETILAENGLDCAFAHEVTIKKREDGRWFYLGNKIDPLKKELIPAYQERTEYK